MCGTLQRHNRWYKNGLTLCFQVVVVRLAVTQGDASVTSNNKVVGLDVGVLDISIHTRYLLLNKTTHQSGIKWTKIEKQ